MFEVGAVQRESGVTIEQLAELEAQLRAEFSGDELLVELHLVRVLEALRRGWITVNDALSVETKAP